MTKKLSRKSMKKPDEVTGFFSTLADVVAENVTYLAVGVGAILAVALLVSGLQFYRSSKQKDIWNRLAEPYESYKNLVLAGREREGEDLYTPEYLRKRFGELSSEFERIANKSPKTVAGRRAMFFAADAAMRAEDFDRASKILESLLRSADSADELGIIRYKYAETLEARGDYEAAAEMFEEVSADKSSPLRELALFSAASCYQKVSLWEKAAGLYETILNDYPDSVMKQEVSDGLMYVQIKLKTKAETSTQEP